MPTKDIDEIVQWYVKHQSTYKNLTKKVESIIREVLNASGVTYYTITSRAKDIESFRDKAKKDKYTDPIAQIKDLAGVRVITFVKSEVKICSGIIRPLFKIDPDHSVDKSKELGSDKVGYRSLHFVAELTDDRLNLPEYKIFKGMYFEIQIRTILEHAWADISHDRNYKFQGVLPPDNDIERRFSLAAAALELVDREFDSIANEIDKYKGNVKQQTEEGNLDIEINTTSLSEYLRVKLDSLIRTGEIEPTFRGYEEKIVNELRRFGIDTLADLDELIGNHIDVFSEINDQNFLGYLRDKMVVQNVSKYFEMAWDDSWKYLPEDTRKFYEGNGVDMDVVWRHVQGRPQDK